MTYNTMEKLGVFKIRQAKDYHFICFEYILVILFILMNANDVGCIFVSFVCIMHNLHELHSMKDNRSKVCACDNRGTASSETL